eukprot:contig_5590_g1261
MESWNQLSAFFAQMNRELESKKIELAETKSQLVEAKTKAAAGSTAARPNKPSPFSGKPGTVEAWCSHMDSYVHLIDPEEACRIASTYLDGLGNVSSNHAKAHNFSIKLAEDAQPRRSGIYRLAETGLEQLKSQLADLIRKGFIQPSSSPYGSSVVFAAKKDGSWPLCIDYRALNRLTVKNAYPLPRIDDIFYQLRKAKLFTKIDLCSGYHQIRFDPETIPLTAFRSKFGFYEFTVLPFGLTYARAVFMNLMNDVFRPYLYETICVYLADILIYSETYEDHIKHLKLALEKLREHRLYAKLRKCQFARTTVNYLGHVISDRGFSMEDDKVHAIQS